MGAARTRLEGKGQLEARLGQQGQMVWGHWSKMVGVGHWSGIPDRGQGSSQGWDSTQGIGFQTRVGFQSWDGIPDTGGVPDRG